jgi:probable rRNA maturation factor
LAKISFYNHEVQLRLQGKQDIKSWLAYVAKTQQKEIKRLKYIFCSDHEILRLNTQFLNHNYYTDILTFDLSSNKSLEAEIYISVDRVIENAESLGINMLFELLRVMIHGLLHLLGYQDKTPKQKSMMTKKEDFYLTKVKVSRETGTVTFKN